MELRDRIILVTGASRGIGRAIALAFAGRGARVAVHYHRDEAAARATLAALAAVPGPDGGGDGGGDGAAGPDDGRHLAFAADVADPEAVRRLVDDVVARMGGVDVLVNNAGIYDRYRVNEVGYDEWQEVWHRTLAVNLVGPANLIHQVVPHMIRAGGGRIVNISSRGAFRGEPESPAYGASKAGLNALGQSMARALAPHGIYVGTVAPGYVETDMAAEYLAGPKGDYIRNQSPTGRVARPEEVAAAAVFLASPGSEFTTGCILDVNGASYLRS